MCYRDGEAGDVGGVKLTRPDAMTVKTLNKEQGTRNEKSPA